MGDRKEQRPVTTQFEVDYDDLAYAVVSRMAPVPYDDQGDNVHACFLNFLLRTPETFETRYLNPMFTVEAASATPAFFRAAKRAQLAWLKAFTQAVWKTQGNLKRGQRDARKKHPLLNQLQFTGVMIADGKHLFPGKWEERIRVPAPEKAENLVGQVFTRLTVIEAMTEQRCRCRCACGKEHIVYVRHLLTERTKSCGCLRAEMDKRFQDRKATRARH